MFSDDGENLKLVDLGLSYYNIKTDINEELQLDLSPGSCEEVNGETLIRMKKDLSTIRYCSPEQIFG